MDPQDALWGQEESGQYMEQEVVNKHGDTFQHECSIRHEEDELTPVSKVKYRSELPSDLEPLPSQLCSVNEDVSKLSAAALSKNVDHSQETAVTLTNVAQSKNVDHSQETAVTLINIAQSKNVDHSQETVVTLTNGVQSELKDKDEKHQRSKICEIFSHTSCTTAPQETCSVSANVNKEGENTCDLVSVHELQSLNNQCVASAVSESFIQSKNVIVEYSTFSTEEKMDSPADADCGMDTSTDPGHVTHDPGSCSNNGPVSTAQNISHCEGAGTLPEVGWFHANGDPESSDCTTNKDENITYNSGKENSNDDCHNYSGENINGDCHDKIDDSNGTFTVQNVNIKLEPYDSEYEISELNYCNDHRTQNPDSRFDKESVFPDQHVSECEKTALQPSSKCQVDTGHSNVNGSNMCGECDTLNVNVKVEPDDSVCDKPELRYRSGAIVVYSDSDDTSSTMFSNNEVAGSDADRADNGISDEEVVERLNAKKISMLKSRSRTEGEVFPEELPPIEYLVISPEEGVSLELLGVVSGIVGVLVIVKADQNSPALFDDTVLFLEGRQPLGLVFEIFGTVEQPYYSVRFNSSKDIKDREIAVGAKVFFAPKADNLTKYVFIAELKKIKFNDASWEYDNEPPPSQLEFSDDEEERKARRQQQNKGREAQENEGTSGHKKRRRKKPTPELTRDPGGPQLLQGDLNRNPFGNRSRMFHPPTSSCWPVSGGYNKRGSGRGFHGPRPDFSPRSPQELPPSSFAAYRKPWPPPTGFGERPDWNCQSGMLGDVPHVSASGRLQLDCFGSGGSFGSRQFRAPPPRFNSTSCPPPSPQSGNAYNPGFSQNSSHVGGPFFHRVHPQQTGLAAPTPQFHSHRPPGFPLFNSSCPPPFINPVFNRLPPP